MTAPTPDHVPCRHPHCRQPISWDETCWTHDDTGFADCGLLILDPDNGQPVATLFGPGIAALVDPTILQPPPHARTLAEPEDPWS